MANHDIAHLEIRIDQLYGKMHTIQERLDEHIGNAHSRSSSLKQSGGLVALVSALYAIAEAVRRFLF